MPTIDEGKKPIWSKQRKQFARRKESNQKFYNSQMWRGLRKSFLSKNPLCCYCEQKGIIKAARVADHIKPINQGGAKLDCTNLQPLCDSCHNKKSAKENIF